MRNGRRINALKLLDVTQHEAICPKKHAGKLDSSGRYRETHIGVKELKTKTKNKI